MCKICQISIEFAAKTVRGHRIFFLSASRFQFVAIGPAKILKIGQEIMSLWHKKNFEYI